MENLQKPEEETLKYDGSCDGAEMSTEEKKIKSEQLKQEGNLAFKGKQLDEAIALYSQAINLCPSIYEKERSVLFNNRAAAYFHKHGESSECDTNIQDDDDGQEEKRNNLTEVEEEQDQETGNTDVNGKTERKKTESWLDKCVADCTSSIDLNADYVKPYLKRAQAYHKMGKEKLDSSLEDYEMVVKIDPSMKECYQTINQLKEEIDKRNEEMKNEMIGKLKDIGNVVLNKFGLSTDNFQMVKNPDTGSYSINFKS